jgi:hypothetical protein
MGGKDETFRDLDGGLFSAFCDSVRCIRSALSL